MPRWSTALTSLVVSTVIRLFVLHVRSSCQRVKVATMKISGKTVAASHHVQARSASEQTNVKVVDVEVNVNDGDDVGGQG